MSGSQREPSSKRATRQRPIGIPDDLYEDCLAIAQIRGESDLIGRGLPVVVRRALTQYRGRFRHLLDQPRD